MPRSATPLFAKPLFAKIDLAALLIAMATMALAGATDVYGLLRLHDVFVSFMSGNTTRLGLALGHGDWPRAGLIAGVVALFIAGAVVGSIVTEWTGRLHAAAVLALVALLLCVPLLHDPLTAPALVRARGALNTVMDHVGDTSIGLTYVTGGLVKLARGLGRWACGVREPRDFLLQAPLWLSLLAGAVGAAWLQQRLGARHYWPLPVLAALLVPCQLWHASTAPSPAP